MNALTKVKKEDVMEPVLFQVGFLKTEPFDKQIQVLRCKAKHKVLCCGRRGGKTRLVAGEIIRGGVFNLYPRQLVTTPVYRNIKPIFSQIIKYLNESGLIVDILKIVKSSPQRIEWKSGAYVDFGSLDRPHNLRGEAYDRIFRDESSFEKEEADDVLRPMMFDTDADTWKTGTPWKKNQFYDDYNRGLKGDSSTQSFHWTSFDNPHLVREAIEKEIEEYGENSPYVQAEIYGRFVTDIDSYFKQSLIEACLDEDYQLVTEDKLLYGI